MHISIFRGEMGEQINFKLEQHRGRLGFPLPIEKPDIYLLLG